ncbi:MAG: hypothetical protein CSB13_06630 [Chloroflexi bacterium]|nr:MAG: hypothetical protein CSB13_06630 [Chloroflexota bacterium]
MEKLREARDVLAKIYIARVELSAGNAVLTSVVIMALSLIVGLVVLGWWVFPVEWDYSAIEPEVVEVVREVPVEVPVPVTCDNMDCIGTDSKYAYVRMLSEWNAFMPNSPYFPMYLDQLSDIDSLACDLADGTDDTGEMRRYIKVAYEKNGQGCQ